MTRLTAAFFLGTSLALSAPAMAFDISAMTDDEKAAFGEAVRDYLMENPQVLIESINVLENQPLGGGVPSRSRVGGVLAIADAAVQAVAHIRPRDAP